MQPFEALLERASDRVEGTGANQALWNIRAQLQAEYANVVCYEMVVDERSTWDGFLHLQIPRLTEHLSAKGLPMLGGPSVLLSVWSGPSLFLFDCESFFRAIREIEQVSPAELDRRIAAWRAELGLGLGTVKHAALPESSDLADLPSPVSQGEDRLKAGALLLPGRFDGSGSDGGRSE